MARRFGGTFSPDGSAGSDDRAKGAAAPDGAPEGFRGARVSPVGARANLMFLPPVAMGLAALFTGAQGLVLGLAAAALWFAGAGLLREGLKAEAAFADRRIARPPLPRKTAAALLAGGGAALAALAHDGGLIAAGLYAVASAGLHVVAFGIDPLRAKGAEHMDQFQQDRVARVVDEAEAYLADMEAAARRAGDRQVLGRIERFAATARDLIRTVEDDPRDLTAARKYLGVYLMGARDAALKFADIHARTRDTQAKTDFLALLDDLEKSFGQKTRTLLLDTNSDLGIEIDVLRERLQREGVRVAPAPDPGQEKE